MGGGLLSTLRVCDGKQKTPFIYSTQALPLRGLGCLLGQWVMENFVGNLPRNEALCPGYWRRLGFIKSEIGHRQNETGVRRKLAARTGQVQRPS